MQERGGHCKLVAFLSKLMDPGCRGWPICLQVVAATAILVEEGSKLTFGGHLMVYTPHTFRTILTQRSGQWMTDSRILKYETILMEKDDLVLRTDKALNPSQFLYRADPSEQEHDCLEITDYQTKMRVDRRKPTRRRGVSFH